MRNALVKLSFEERQFLESESIARMGTVSNIGMPHVAPVCYALHNDKILVPIDIRAPRKKANLEQQKKVCLVIDHYEPEDWSKLKGVLIQGVAGIIRGGKTFRMARDLIYQRYPPFKTSIPIEEGETHWFVSIKPVRIASWGLKKAS